MPKRQLYKKAALLAAWSFLISLGALGLGALRTDLTGTILTAALIAGTTFFASLIVE